MTDRIQGSRVAAALNAGMITDTAGCVSVVVEVDGM